MEFNNKTIAADRSTEIDTGRVLGNSLKLLRIALNLTQKEIATKLGVGRSTISRIERSCDFSISSLRSYVETLGAKLRIEAEISQKSGLPTYISELIDLETYNEKQLVLPLLESTVPKSNRDVVLSIKPKYSEKIFEGKKTVELRRRFPVSIREGTTAYIYSTSPVRAMVGCADIVKVIKLPLKDIWQTYSKPASITKVDFHAYFDGLDEGYVLEFGNIEPLPRLLGLNELRSRFDFKPPQSFYYIKPDLERALQDEYSVIPH